MNDDIEFPKNMTNAQRLALKHEEHMARYRASQPLNKAVRPKPISQSFSGHLADAADPGISAGVLGGMTHAEMIRKRREEHLSLYRERISREADAASASSEAGAQPILPPGSTLIPRHNDAPLTEMERTKRKREEHLAAYRQLQNEKREVTEIARREWVAELERYMAKNRHALAERERLKLEAVAHLQSLVERTQFRAVDANVGQALKNLHMNNFQEHHIAVLEMNLPELLQWMDIERSQDVTDFIRLIATKESAAQIERDKADFDQRLLATVVTHLAVLHKKRRQLLWTNDYGVVKGMDKWIREIRELIDDLVHPPVHAQVDYEHCARKVISWLDSRIPALPTESTVEEMEGGDFELHCAEILRGAGWTVSHNGRTGDQGVDLIAELNGLRVALQCKRYASSVGNSAVQEIFAGQKFEMCDVGGVISNAKFTASAIQLSQTLGVLLVDISELGQLDSIVRAASSGSRG